MIYPKMNKVKVYPNENKVELRLVKFNQTFYEWLRDHAASDLYFFGWGLVEEEGGVKLVSNELS
jgi:hypothetical protein